MQFISTVTTLSCLYIKFSESKVEGLHFYSAQTIFFLNHVDDCVTLNLNSILQFSGSTK